MNEGELKEAKTPAPQQPFRSEFQPLIDELYREEVLEAHRMSPEEKFLLGEEPFNFACSVTLAGIRSENPEFNDEACQRELERPLQLRESMEVQQRLGRPG